MNLSSIYPIIVVENMDEAQAFYCDTLGFQVKHNFKRTTTDGSRVVVLCNDKGLQFEIMEQAKSGPVNFELGLYGLRMNVDDIEMAWEELKAQGCQALTGILEGKVVKVMYLKDVNGVNITLVQHLKK